MEENGEFLCLSCALIFEQSYKNPLTCPDCEFITDIESYIRKLILAYDAAAFGYFYRKVYEADKKRGQTDTRYALAVDDIFIFLALAIISGVVGNAAYDGSKAAIKRIYAQAVAKYKESNEVIQLKILEDENEFRRFNEYVKEFPKSLKKLPVEVREAIIEEMIVDVMQDKLPILLKTSENKFEEVRCEIIKESRKEVTERLKNHSKNKHRWKNVSQTKNSLNKK